MAENQKLPCVSITAYDAEDTALTSTIEIEVTSPAQAIELWQELRKVAERYALKQMKKS